MIKMHCAGRALESSWAPSCLPKSEAALQASPLLVEVLEAEARLSDYRSVLDAALACFVPESREPLQAHYGGKGRLLQEMLSTRAVARLDQRLASILNEIEKLQPVYIQLIVSGTVSELSGSFTSAEIKADNEEG